MRWFGWALLLACVAIGGCREASLTAAVSGPAAASAVDAESPSSSLPVAEAPPAPRAFPGPEIWRSSGDCQRALAQRPGRRPGTGRVGTWNLRWFPDGGPGLAPHATRATDLRWLACAIAMLNVDLLAVQEFKRHARAGAATRELLDLLDRDTGGAWRIELDDCPNAAGQHVGLLFDTRRVQRLSGQRFDAFNPHGEACRNQLRPGQGGYFRFPGGLDLHVISVHFKSGTQRRSLELRRRTLDAFGTMRRTAGLEEADQDVLVVGDFNTMGCPKCSPAVSAVEEIAELDRRVERAGFRRVRPDRGCSEYYRGGGGLLDHFVVSSEMAEAPRREIRVAGYCRVEACSRIDGAMPLAYDRLSDHCPLVAEFIDRDLD